MTCVLLWLLLCRNINLVQAGQQVINDFRRKRHTAADIVG